MSRCTFDPLISVAILADARDTPAQSEAVYWSTFSGVALSEHVEQSKKDGPGYIYADLRGGKCDHHVVSVSCLAYDIDGKLTAQQVCDAIAVAGVEAVVYTTFNHLKTESTVGAKSVRTFAKAYGFDETPSNVSMQAFCAANRKFDHLAGVRIGNHGETVRARMYDNEFDAYVIEHNPEHTTRVIIPLTSPIPIREVGKDGYKAIYHAVGHNLLGDAYDAACCNPARLNYAPSRRRSSTGHFIRTMRFANGLETHLQ